jgi:peptide/nickel transport system ATP-binding protein
VTSKPVLEVENLDIEYKLGPDWKTAVRDINFVIERGQSFGLVGESGCGKSTVAMAIMHYLPRNGRIGRGSIRLAGRDFTHMGGAELRQVRVNQISMV